MKQRLISILFSLALVPMLRAETLPFQQINTPTNQPNIDAAILVNASSFSVVNGSGNYYTRNTSIYTNLNTGIFSAVPGFTFQNVTNVTKPALQVVNFGTIVGSSGGLTITFGGGGSQVSGIQGGSIQIYATNIINSGTIDSGADGVVHLEGRNLNLSRGVLTAGGDDPFPGVVNTFQGSNREYVNPSGVTDLYWAAGTGQRLVGQPNGLRVDSNPFFPPTPRSPAHEVEFFSPGSFNGTQRQTLSIPQIFGTTFNGLVYFQPNLPATNQNYTIVFVATNATDTNYTTTIRFSDSGPDVIPVIEFNLPDSDPVTGQNFQNKVYFVDRTQRLTNVNVAPNLQFPGAAFRPNAYEITRGVPNEWLGASSANFPLSSVTYFQTGYSNRVVTNIYYAYSAQIDGTPKALANPDAALGRVEIKADNLDISRTRIRAESYVAISSTNLISSTNASVDAPIVTYNVTSVSNTFVLTNLIPRAVRRFNGTVSAWTGLWTNNVAGIQIQYHVLIVDASQLQAVQAVITPELFVKGTNVIANNILNPTKSFRMDSPAVTFGPQNQLLLTNFSTIPNILSSNFPTLQYFTNQGSIVMVGEGKFGYDRPSPLKSMVNSGLIEGTTLSIASEAFTGNGIMSADFGPITLQASSGKLQGGTMQAYSDITILGDDFKIRASTNVTFGALRLSITNSMTDNGPDAQNDFRCNFGFNLLIKPATGDLLGTTLTSQILGISSVPHLWAGEDRGASRAGYSNNAAIGRLVLNASSINSLFSIAGTGTSNAMYVDYLDLQGVVAANLDSVLEIASNMRIYFANSNVKVETLDGALGGRLRWVKNYVGANSTVDVILPSGQTAQVNLGLLNSTSIDSDNDGIVNAFDISPFDGVVMKNTVTFTNVPPLKAVITWDAAAETIYTIESTTSLTPPDWQFFQSFTNSNTANGPVSVQLPVPVGDKQRYYRVVYIPGL